MGDRANISVKENDNDSGVYLYTHWGGERLPAVLQRALTKHWRWDDCSYLTRIIFDEMSMGHQGEETNFGISTGRTMPDHEPDIVVDVANNTVEFNGQCYSFENYIKLNEQELLW